MQKSIATVMVGLLENLGVYVLTEVNRIGFLKLYDRAVEIMANEMIKEGMKNNEVHSKSVHTDQLN